MAANTTFTTKTIFASLVAAIEVPVEFMFGSGRR